MHSSISQYADAVNQYYTYVFIKILMSSGVQTMAVLLVIYKYKIHSEGKS